MKRPDILAIAGCVLFLSWTDAPARAYAKPNAADAVEQVRTRGFDAYVTAVAAGEDAVDGLLGIVRDKQASYEARATAINAVGQIRSQKAIKPLLVALKDPDQRIRRCAAIALGTIGDPAARAAVAKLATSDPFEWKDPQTGRMRYLVRADARKAVDMLSGRTAPGSRPAAGDAKAPMLALPEAQTKYERLAWPHQPPGLSPPEVDKLNREVWVINDCPLYQADEKGELAYLHGGLDIILENGTKIYAMKDGWVKSTDVSTVTVADNSDGQPGYGWEYTHLGNIQVQVGEHVKQGTWIGQVEFEGLPHVHLTKVYSQGDSWGRWRYMCMPNGHFDYADTQPPVIKTPFDFLPNDSNTRIQPDQAGNVVLSGKVDIVVGMRDPGEFAHSRESGFGDRLGVSRIEWEVRPAGQAGGTGRKFAGFDFEHMVIKSGVYDRAFNAAMARTICSHWADFDPASRSGDKMLTYYVITNCPQTEDRRELGPQWADACWDTTEADRGGRSVFPDGRYEITVRAWDFRGNRAEAAMAIFIRNKL